MKTRDGRQGWRTIDSAPKDGSEVVVWDGLSVTIGCYFKPDTIEEWWEDVRSPDEPKDRPDVAAYQEYLEEGAFGWIKNTAEEIAYLNPSYWQPLPSPPEAS